jgi:hypothetical protein
MIRRWKLSLVVAGVLALAAVGIGLGLAAGHNGAPSAVGATAARTFTLPQQKRLEQGIAASSITSQARVVAVELRSQFEGRGKPLLPPGSRIAINTVTFHELSPQLATVDATVSGPARGHWQLVLVREAGQWLLLSTTRLA